MKRRRPQPTKAELLAKLPRAFRARLTRSQIVELGLCHHETHDAIVRGEAQPDTMWSYVGSVLTWWRVSRELQAGVPELDMLLQVATRLVERYGRHGAVRFDGRDMQLASAGLDYMDQLAELVDWPTALAASTWAEHEVNRLAAGSKALEKAAA